MKRTRRWLRLVGIIVVSMVATFFLYLSLETMGLLITQPEIEVSITSRDGKGLAEALRAEADYYRYKLEEHEATEAIDVESPSVPVIFEASLFEDSLRVHGWAKPGQPVALYADTDPILLITDTLPNDYFTIQGTYTDSLPAALTLGPPDGKEGLGLLPTSPSLWITSTPSSQVAISRTINLTISPMTATVEYVASMRADDRFFQELTGLSERPQASIVEDVFGRLVLRDFYGNKIHRLTDPVIEVSQVGDRGTVSIIGRPIEIPPPGNLEVELLGSGNAYGAVPLAVSGDAFAIHLEEMRVQKYFPSTVSWTEGTMVWRRERWPGSWGGPSISLKSAPVSGPRPVEATPVAEPENFLAFLRRISGSVGQWAILPSLAWGILEAIPLLWFVYLARQRDLKPREYVVRLTAVAVTLCALHLFLYFSSALQDILSRIEFKQLLFLWLNHCQLWAYSQSASLADSYPLVVAIVLGLLWYIYESLRRLNEDEATSAPDEFKTARPWLSSLRIIFWALPAAIALLFMRWLNRELWLDYWTVGRLCSYPWLLVFGLGLAGCVYLQVWRPLREDVGQKPGWIGPLAFVTRLISWATPSALGFSCIAFAGERAGDLPFGVYLTAGVGFVFFFVNLFTYGFFAWVVRWPLPWHLPLTAASLILVLPVLTYFQLPSGPDSQPIDPLQLIPATLVVIIGISLAVGLFTLVYGILSVEKGKSDPSRLTKRTWAVVYFLAFLSALPKKWFLFTAEGTRWVVVRNLLHFAYEVDDVLPYVLLVGLLVIFREASHRPGQLSLSPPTRSLVLLLFSCYLIGSTRHWMFIPIPLLIGYWLISRWLLLSDRKWQEIVPAVQEVMAKRGALIESIIELNWAEKAYRGFKKTLDGRLASGEISYDEHRDAQRNFKKQLCKKLADRGTYEEQEQQVDEREEWSVEAWLKAHWGGFSPKRIALTFGPAESPWQNARIAATYGFFLSIPWVLLYLRDYMTTNRPYQPYPVVDMLGELPIVCLKWTLYAFFFGYFFHCLRGRDGLRKGLCFFIALTVPVLPLEAFNAYFLTDWQAILFWVLQIFIQCVSLGLAMDYEVLRRSGYNWRVLVEVHNLTTVSASASSILLAAGTAVMTLLTSKVQQIIRAAMELILSKPVGQ
jgi:hypothetical protein